jgi:uncharacterized iron-regulated protein
MLTAEHADTLQKLGKANIIYLGETHDRLVDHQAQLAILKALHRSNPRLAIAMEMFQRPDQAALDAYLAETVDEETLLAQTKYRQRWGFDWHLYAPIVRLAKAQKLPMLAINAPTEVIRKVARLGLEALAPADWQWIPPRSAIDTSSKTYRQRLLNLYASFHQGKGNSDGFERFFQAQVLWDETMAEAIAQSWLKSPERTLIALVGQGHVLYGDGIPSRVARRLEAAARQPWEHYSVILNPSSEMKALSPRAADFFWTTPP